MKVIINENLFKDIPNLMIGIVIARNIKNDQKIDLTQEFSVISEKIKKKFADVELAEYPVIKAWRNVYKSFGEKKCRSSIEALIRRIMAGKELPRINPLVDIYNLISLTHEMPCGGEDLAVIDEDINLTYANSDEEFIPLGETEKERPNQNEVIYKFGSKVICRNFNYRESDLTKLTEATTTAILVIESLDNDLEGLKNALTDLAGLAKKHLSATAEIQVLDRNNLQLGL